MGKNAVRLPRLWPIIEPKRMFLWI